MNKKMALLAAAIVFAFPSLSQRTVLDPDSAGPYVKKDLVTKNYLAYPNIREADAMWAKSIWRIIDVREKINLPLGHPNTGTIDRRSLMDVLWSAVREGSITAYANDEFTEVRTDKDIERLAGAGIDTIWGPDADPPYNLHPIPVKRELATESVIQYRIKEEWFFDKQRSIMDVRIIGLAPIVYATDDTGAPREGGETKPLFWVFFPEARWLLSKEEAFNMQNDAQRRSFDDIFQKRLFN